MMEAVTAEYNSPKLQVYLPALEGMVPSLGFLIMEVCPNL
jgi:hypothetical protein